VASLLSLRAKRSNPLFKAIMDCFVATLLAMTKEDVFTQLDVTSEQTQKSGEMKKFGSMKKFRGRVRVDNSLSG
jgi:hypothetical protein